MSAIRRVRTPAGARRFRLPIGAPIRPAGPDLPGLRMPGRSALAVGGPGGNPIIAAAVSGLSPELADRTRRAIEAGAQPGEARWWADRLGAPELAIRPEVRAAAWRLLGDHDGSFDVREAAAALLTLEPDPETGEIDLDRAAFIALARRHGITDARANDLFDRIPGRTYLALERADLETAGRIMADFGDSEGPDALEAWRLWHLYAAARDLHADPQDALSQAGAWDDKLDDIGASYPDWRRRQRLAGKAVERILDVAAADPEVAGLVRKVGDKTAILAPLDERHLKALAAAKVAIPDWIPPDRRDVLGRVLERVPVRKTDLMQTVLREHWLFGIPGMDRLGPADLERVADAAVRRRAETGSIMAAEQPLLISVHASRRDVDAIEAVLGWHFAPVEVETLVRKAESVLGPALWDPSNRDVAVAVIAHLIDSGGDLDGAVDLAHRMRPGLVPDPTVTRANVARLGSLRRSTDPLDRQAAAIIEARLVDIDALFRRPKLIEDARELAAARVPERRAHLLLRIDGAVDRWRKLADLPPEERTEAAVLAGPLAETYDAARASGADHLTAWRRALGIPERLPDVAPSGEGDDDRALVEGSGLWDDGGKVRRNRAALKRQLAAGLASMLPPEMRPGLALLTRTDYSDNPASVHPSPEDGASDLIRAWAVSANDQNPASLLVQRRIERLFGLEGTAHWDLWAQAADRVAEEDETVGPLVDVLLAAMYASTQWRLRQAGVTSLQGWRGWSWYEDEFVMPSWASADRGDAVEAPHRPASSYSVSRGVAERFAGPVGAMTAARFPAERILAVPRTGFGCADEVEFVVLGGPLRVRKVD
jgi:hypothetical protein